MGVVVTVCVTGAPEMVITRVRTRVVCVSDGSLVETAADCALVMTDDEEVGDGVEDVVVDGIVLDEVDEGEVVDC